VRKSQGRWGRNDHEGRIQSKSSMLSRGQKKGEKTTLSYFKENKRESSGGTGESSQGLYATKEKADVTTTKGLSSKKGGSLK